MSNVHCSNETKNPIIDMKCKCNETLKQFENLSNDYNTRLQKYNSDYDNYINSENRYKSWENKTGDFVSYRLKLNELRDEKKDTSWYWKCFPPLGGSCSNPDYCRQEFGNNWSIIEDLTPPISFELKYRCQRNEQGVNDDFNSLYGVQYHTDKPKRFPLPEKPKPISNFNLQCCNINLNEISTDKEINISSIKNNCSQNINSSIEKEVLNIQQEKLNKIKYENEKRKNVYLYTSIILFLFLFFFLIESISS